MRSMVRGVRCGMACAMCVCLAFGLAGCGQGASSAPTAKDSWSAVLRRKAETAGKDSYVASVFGDGAITDAEMNDATERMAACLAKHDITFSRNADGSAQMLNDASMDVDLVRQYSDQCGKDTGYETIDMYYQEIRSNPQHVSDAEFQKSVFDCLARGKLLDSGMTYDEFAKLFADNVDSKSQGNSSPTEWDERFGQYENASDPRYDAVKGSQWQECTTDPTNN